MDRILPENKKKWNMKLSMIFEALVKFKFAKKLEELKIKE